MSARRPILDACVRDRARRWSPCPRCPLAASPETKAERDARMAWWRDARFGMFIHWGLYAVPAGEYKGQRVEGDRRVDHVVGEHSSRRLRALRRAVQPGEVRRRRRGSRRQRTPA